MTGLACCHSCSVLQHTLSKQQSVQDATEQSAQNVLQNIKYAANTHLWDDPVFPVGSLCFGHTLGPGSDVPRTVISVTLEHKLPLALLAGQQSSKGHPICYSVQDLQQQTTQSRSWQEAGGTHTHTQCYPGLHKNTTARLLAQPFPAH